MKRYTWIFLLAVALMALAGCASSTVEASEPTPTSVPSVGLAGTSWVLSSLGGDLPMPGVAITLDFGADGSLSGFDGCNNFNMGYVQDGSSLTVAQPGASTLMACEADVMSQAAAFMGALTRTTSFTANARQLILQDGNEILATFVSASQTLVDSSWEVTAYNNGREAVVGLVPGSEIVVNLGADGSLTGNAGCNNFITSFTAASGTVSVAPIGTTFRTCDSPAGVMEQEAEFLAALAASTTYSIRGNLLETRGDNDQMMVVMARKLLVDLPEPAPSVPWGRITAPSGVNIRSGPGTNFPVIGFARDGDEGEIVGRSADNRWWAAAAALPDGIGWVSADFVIATDAQDVPVIQVAPPVIVVPTAAPPATPTPVPAATATPSAQISFDADRININQGECATLRWNVVNVQAVWVYPQGQSFDRFPRAGQGSEQVCPPVTTTYEMRVLRRDGSTEFRQVTITVAPSNQPQIAFWADSTNINQGECTRLHWDVQNVRGVWVYPQGSRYTDFPRVGQDSERVCPSNTTTYEMRVLQNDGATVFNQITVNVNVTAPTATPAPSNPLAGTRWNVTSINNGQGINTLLEGTSATMEFGTDGIVGGNSGCNTYSAGYQVNGSSLSIGQAQSTQMMCAEPEGLSTQEQEFLAALQRTASFRLEGNALTLLAGNGNITVTAQR